MKAASPLRRTILALWVAVVIGGAPLNARAADELDNWTLLHPKPIPAGLLFDILFDGEEFVAVGNGGFLVTSGDGRAWQMKNTQTGMRLISIAHGDGVYLAGGLSGGQFLRSVDKQTWLTHSIPELAPIFGFCHGIDVWLMLNGSVSRSLDQGVTWAKVDQSPSVNDAIFEEGKFVAVGRGIFTSTNGLNWVQRETTQMFNSIAYGDGRFVAVGVQVNGGLIATSDDAINWFIQDVPNPVWDVVFADGRFVTVGGAFMGTGEVLSSTDGVYFEAPPPEDNGLQSVPNAVTYGNGVFVTVGNGLIATSGDGSTWDPLFDSVLDATGRLATDQTSIVLPSQRSIVVTTNGTDYSTHPFSSRVSIISLVLHDGTRFVAGGGSGPFLVSTNAQDWVEVPPPDEMIVLGMACGGGKLLATGYLAEQNSPPVALTSTNAVDWNLHLLPASTPPARVCYGKGLFLATDNAGGMLISSDGLAWSPRPFPHDNYVGDVRFVGDRFFALGDPTYGLMVSSDTISWRQIEPRAGGGFTADVTFGNGRYLLARNTGDGSLHSLRSSYDGITWTDEFSSGLSLLRLIYADHAFFVLGAGGMVLRSDFTHIPRIESFTVVSQHLNFEVSGELGLEYHLQSSPDLTNWTHRAVFTNLNRVESLSIPNEETSGAGFWRAFTQ